jgi:hypothetical protein
LSFVVFNHHSLPFESAEQARRSAPLLLRVLVRARILGLTAIRIDESLDPSWRRIELAPGFTWSEWMSTDGARPENADLKRAFLSVASASASPLLQSEDERALGLGCECRLDGRAGSLRALASAHCLDAPLTSHATRAPWDITPIAVEVDDLDPAGHLRTARHGLLNLHSLPALDEHRAELLARRDKLLQDAVDLWRQRGTLFPDLVFCPGVEQNLRPWPYGAGLLARVRNALSELQRFVSDWRDGLHFQYTFDALRAYLPSLSDESDTVKSDPVLAAFRKFRDEKGTSGFYYHHIKLQQGFRIHYLPDGGAKRIRIGYIGKHLKLKR